MFKGGSFWLTHFHLSETTGITTGGMGRHAHARVDRRRRSGAIRRTSRTRVILATTPAQANSGVTDGIALHLIDSHLSSMSLHELHETTALAGRDLDVCDLAEALEERTELVLGDVTRETADKDGGVVGIGELVHGLGGGGVEADWGSAHGGVHGTAGAHAGSTASAAGALVLRGSGGDAHGAVAAVDTLHFGEGALLVCLVGEADETVAAGHAGDVVGHDLGGLDGGEAVLEEADEDILVDFGAEVADEDGELRAAVVSEKTS